MEKNKGLVFFSPWFQYAACVVFGDPLYFIPVTIFCSVLDSLHLCYRLLILVEKSVFDQTKPNIYLHLMFANLQFEISSPFYTL